MNRSTLHVTFACVGGLAMGGLAAGWPWFAQPEPPRAPAAATAPAAPAVPTPRTASAALAEAVRTADGERRWLLLASAAEHATAQDMPALIRLAGEDSGAVSMLATRWAELDPKHMLATVYADFLLPDGSPAALPGRWYLSSVLVESWSKRDPAALIKALNEIPNYTGRDNLRLSATREIAKGDIQLAVRAMRDWNIHEYVPDRKKFAEWVKNNPQEAVDAAAWFGNDYVGHGMLKQAGKTWGQSDPAAALRYASKLPSRQLAAFADEVVGQWAGRDLKAAVEFASAQENPVFRGALAQGLVKEWGKTDAAAALAWSQTNLRGAARNEAIAGLIGATAEKDLHAAGELAAGMEPGPAQDRACASLFETWFNKGREHRDAALEWLADLPDESARRNAMERVHRQWAWREPEAARDFLTGPHGKLASESMVRQVSGSLTSKNPETAMEWAKSLPEKHSAAAQSAVLESWLHIRPDAAADYARKLPAGADRDRAIRDVSRNFAQQSTQRAVDWYRSLTGEAKEQARAAFESASLSREQREALNQAVEGR
jgi:hypothetical protein